MAGKKGKSRGRKAKHGTPASPAASTQAAARGSKHSQLEGPFPDHNGDPPGSGVAADRFADGSYLPSTVSSSRPGSQVSRVTDGDNPSPAQHQAGTALVAIGGDFRHANDSGGREAVWRRRPSGDRDTGGDRDRPAGDHCHNGESLSGSPYLRQSAARQWSWLGYSAKQFRSFAQECPPALDVGADQVRAKIDDVKCRACRDSLHNALGKGLARGGVPLTKLVKLAACRSRENPKQGEGSTSGTQLVAESANRRAASSSLLNGRSDIESHTKWGAGAVDRLRIRAPVTPDLLRQIIGVVQASAGAGAAAVAPVASSPVGGAAVKSPGSGTAGRRLRDLSAEEWLSTYPAPSAARLEGDACNGVRGTGTGSLAITRAQSSVSVSGDERNPWALMDRAERAKDSAFKCCGVIEVMTGGGVHDPTAASNGGVSANGSAGIGTVSGVSSGSVAGSGGGSAIAANMEWNPQFAPRLQEAETALVDWLTELTMALHGLTFQFTLAFVRDEGVAERGGDCGGKSGGGRDDLAESIALTEVLWTAYEESIKKQLDLTLEARREHLREQSQPMGFAAQNRACTAELLERKRAEMAALHEATIGVMRAGKVKRLLVRAERARQRWSGLLVDEELHALDDLVERVLKARLQIFKGESFAYNAPNDIIQAEQIADAQLKAVAQEGEDWMDSFKVVVESRFSEELNPTVYPQSPALTSALQSWLSSFKADWEGNETTQQLHAHIRERHVQDLCQTLVAKKHRLKTSKEEAAELGKKQRHKRNGKTKVSNSNGNEQSEDFVKQRELKERCQSLVTAIALTQQDEIETCLSYRFFAVGQLHRRYRRLRLFFAQLICRVAARAHLTRHLCGVDSDADKRVKMVGACLMLGAVEEACLRWTAARNERQLVEGVGRKDASLDAKRRKRERAKAKVRKNKNTSAAAATAAAATVEVVAAKGSISSEDGTKGERTPTSESARDRVARMPAAGEKSINGSVGEATARQGIATAVARVTTSPLPNGTAVGAGAGSRTASRSRGEVGKNSPKADRFPTTPGWRTAEGWAPVGDEDGFVTKTRQSATAQDWRAQYWGAGNLDNGSSGMRNDRSRLRGGGGSFNLHGGRGVERTRWVGCRRGSLVAPEEVLPEAAPAPLEPNEETSAGGAVNNAGEFSGGQEVLGAGKKLLMGAGGAAAPTPLEPTEEASAGGVANNAGEFSGGQEVLGAGEKLLMGAGGAAAPASAELGPEREIARVTKGDVENADRRVSSGGAKVACGDSVEMRGKPAEREDERAPAIAETMVSGDEVEWEEEEAYVFQFGTVNLPDDDVVARDGLQFGTVNLPDDDVVAKDCFRGEGQEAQGSPESRRYEGGVVEKEAKPRPHYEVSPGSFADAEMQFDERVDLAEGSQDLGGGADEARDGSSLSQGRENNAWGEGRVRSATAPAPEEGEGGAAVAAVVGAAGAKGTPGPRTGKKAKGGRRRGGRRGNRAKSGAMTGVEVASTTKNGFPSPSGPLPRGLANASGENNCFLNVVVQSLWHLDTFREKFGGNTDSDSNSNSSTAGAAWGKKPRAWGAAVVDVGNDNAPEELSHRVESALRAVFRELSGGGRGDGRKGEGAGITGTTSASVATLRMALARVSGGRFGLGKMDDAAEAMETILGCLVQGASAAAVQQVFSMRIREVLACPKCGIFSPEVPTTYEANVFYAHMSALQEAREKYPACSFDVALREASLGDLTTCTNAECPLALRRERLPSRRSITGEPPSVFSLGLVWKNWGPALVADVLETMSRVIDLDVVFCTPSNKRGGGGGPGMVWPLEEDVSFGKAYLKGFFCFHAQKHHYVAFVHNRGRGEWLLLDDDKAIPIGPEFSGVLARCKRDGLHPSLLFYER